MNAILETTVYILFIDKEWVLKIWLTCHICIYNTDVGHFLINWIDAVIEGQCCVEVELRFGKKPLLILAFFSPLSASPLFLSFPTGLTEVLTIQVLFW